MKEESTWDKQENKQGAPSLKEEEYYAFLEQLPVAAYLVKDTPDFELLYGNQSFYHFLGCTKEEMQYRYGYRWGALIDANGLAELQIAAREASQEAPAMLEQKIRKSDGTDIWFSTKAYPILFHGEKSILCISYEITKEKGLEQAVLEYQETAKAVGNRTHNEAFQYNLEHQTARIYAASTVLSQIKEEEQSGYDSFQALIVDRGLVHPDFFDLFYQVFDSVLEKGKSAVCELKMKNTEGGFSWIRFSLEVREDLALAEGYALGVFANITHQKETSLNYLMETQFYQALLSEMDAYGQVDVTEDRITRIGGLWNLYNELIDTVPYSDLAISFIKKVVHPDDRAHYIEVMQKENFIQSYENGVERLGCEFRRIVEQNKMMWMELNVHLFLDPFSKHLFALLYIKNIDEQKKREFALVHESERDPLTNAYHKKSTEAMIKEYLIGMGQKELCAFMILDIDQFKSLNQSYGYLAGDQVLTNISNILSRIFRKSDIIGRIGGDGFALFLKNIVSQDKIKERLTVLCDMIQREVTPQISCSIGVTTVIGPSSYSKLLQQAETALYLAKEQPEEKFIFYSEQIASNLQDSRELEHQMESEKTIPFSSQESDDTVSSRAMFENLVGEQGDMAYLVDPSTYSLLCGNKAFYDRIGLTENECVGMKCYEVMQKRESPCPFCSKANWTRDKFYMWKNNNNALEQKFLIKNKLVLWNGKEKLLALAVDISNDKSIVDTIENNVTESHYVLSGIQRMIEAGTLTESLQSALETIGCFYHADSVQFWEYQKQEKNYEPIFIWDRDGRAQSYLQNLSTKPMVNHWLKSNKWNELVTIENQETMLCYSFDMYQLMKDYGIHNQRWLPLRDQEMELGYLVIENISVNFQNVSFMSSFTGFMMSEWKRRGMIEGILYASSHDDLTNLLSRNQYEKYLQEYNSDQVTSVGIVIANVNDLKRINSIRGFHTGDYYLKQFASMLKQVFPDNSIFRLNGDEFLVIVLGLPQKKLVDGINQLEKCVAADGHFTVSLGHSWDDVERDLGSMIENATQIMKVNKKRYHDSRHMTDDIERRGMLQELIASINNKEFEVFLQPKVNLYQNKIIGAEALIRYRHKVLGIIPPAKFIETLERNNLIRYIDLFVFEEVCKMLERWGTQGYQCPVISLNFSRCTLLERGILNSVETIISHYKVSRKNIEIEITESFANMGKSILYQTAHDFYQAGYSISLDDFGTKYTNLSILADLNFDMLKLDKSLINSVVKQKNNQIILKNIIYMCRDLHIEVIAEGIETKAQESVLQSLGCNLGQGYLYGKPMPIAEFEEKHILQSQKILITE